MRAQFPTLAGGIIRRWAPTSLDPPTTSARPTRGVPDRPSIARRVALVSVDGDAESGGRSRRSCRRCVQIRLYNRFEMDEQDVAIMGWVL